MSGLVLVVDDVESNRSLLKARLENEFFEVLTAPNGAKAVEIAEKEQPDVILMDVMMPEMDGFTATQRLKSMPTTAHIPIVIITDLSDFESRITALESGADEFLIKPPESMELLARVRSLIRLKRISDEWRLRQHMLDQFAEEVPIPVPTDPQGYKNSVVLGVDLTDEMRARLTAFFEADEVTLAELSTGDPDWRERVETHDFDLIMVPFSDDVKSKVRVCSTIRTIDMSRHTPILAVVPERFRNVIGPALEVGINDYIFEPYHEEELKVRIRAQIRKKRYQQALKQGYERSLALALTDPLTGLYNRRYGESHLNKLVGPSASKPNRVVSVLMLDIDRFKEINDTYGHPAGDEVLKEVARRLEKNVRNFDLVARMGGEEFICILPDTRIEIAAKAGERLRSVIASTPIFIPAGNLNLQITISVGVAQGIAEEVDADLLISQADQALYAAKNQGRNRVVKAA